MASLVAVLCCGLALFSSEQGKAPLHVFAAAGTAPAMRAIAAEYTRASGVPVIFNFANSGVLARQIGAGAEFNLFFSANEKWMDHVEKRGLIDPATRTTVLENELVVIVPEGRPTPTDLAAFQGRFATGDQSTPLGIYAREAFTNMKCWEALLPRLCVGDTVNKALNYVALGEADAGVVFRSVAFCASNRVDVAFALPPDAHAPIRFPIAAADTPSTDSLEFITFLKSPAAQLIFKQYGWTPCQTKK